MRTKVNFRSLAVLVVNVAFFLASCAPEEKATPGYIVAYDGNGNTSGTVPDMERNYEPGTIFTILDNLGNLEKDGFSFVGWNTNPYGTGDELEIGSEQIVEDEDFIIYAKWVAGGRLRMNLSNASEFEGHAVYGWLYDYSNTVVGYAKIIVQNGSGSTSFTGSNDSSTEKLFEVGTYYFRGMVDMNDNAESNGYVPDTGDRMTSTRRKTIEINGDKEMGLSVADFPIQL